MAGRLWLALASLVGAYIAGAAVAAVGSLVRLSIVAIVSSGLSSQGSLLPADRVPAVLRLLTEGFAAFATAVLLLGTSTAIYVARRAIGADDDVSAPAIVFATVVAVCVAAGVFLLGPYWLRQHLTPTVGFILVAAAALAGTVPVRTAGRPSPWLYACLALIVAAPLGVEGAWRVQRPRAVVQSQTPRSVPVERREFVRATRFGLTVVAVGRDGTCFYTDGARLTARRPAGSDAWFHEPEDPNARFARGAVAADGSLHVPLGVRVYAFGTQGETRWIYDPGSRTPPEILALGGDGTLYVTVTTGMQPSLRAVNPDGTEKWRADVRARAISLGVDGELFVAGTNVLSAYTVDGRHEWTRDIEFTGQPAVGQDGTLYLAGPRTLTALRRDGTPGWTADITTTGQGVGRTPVIDADGTVYVANPNLWAVGADGAVKWQWEPPVSSLDHAPLITLDGTIVVAAVNGTVYGITPDGTVRWMEEQRSPIHALTRGAAGAIYLALDQAVISLAPKPAANAGPGLWPEERHDAQNTSRAAR